MPTPHIEAKQEDIAKVVLLAGDPLRAKKWAELYLNDAKQINSVRNMLGFTGTTSSGKRVTVMGHGMGLDSVGIYAYELYKFYDVDTIIRFGSAGSYSKNINLKDIILAEKSWTDSNYGLGFGFKEKTLSATPNLISLTKEILEQTKDKHNYKVATVNASSWFYTHNYDLDFDKLLKENIVAVEMESYALYAIAKVLNKQAMTILTISDNLVTKEELSSLERQSTFDWMFLVLNKLLDKI